MMRFLQAALLIAAVNVALSCGSKPGSKPVVLLPATGEVEGWSKAGETRTFDAGNLWEYIDGDAERYVQAGVLRTLTADYRYQNRIEAVADIHVMKAPEGARKLFESESSAESQGVNLGDGARLSRGNLIFRQGPYLVRLTAFQEAPEVGKALVELGRGIERKISQQRTN